MNSANREFQEKRNFIRMKIDTPADVEVINGSETLQGVCRDLSGGGMLIELDTTLPIGTELQVRIASAHGHAPMLNAKAEVARVVAQPGESQGTCMLGLEVLEVF